MATTRSGQREELADLLEVVRAIATHLQIELADIEGSPFASVRIEAGSLRGFG